MRLMIGCVKMLPQPGIWIAVLHLFDQVVLRLLPEQQPVGEAACRARRAAPATSSGVALAGASLRSRASFVSSSIAARLATIDGAVEELPVERLASALRASLVSRDRWSVMPARTGRLRAPSRSPTTSVARCQGRRRRAEQVRAVARARRARSAVGAALDEPPPRRRADGSRRAGRRRSSRGRRRVAVRSAVVSVADDGRRIDPASRSSIVSPTSAAELGAELVQSPAWPGRGASRPRVLATAHRRVVDQALAVVGRSGPDGSPRVQAQSRTTSVCARRRRTRSLRFGQRQRSRRLTIVSTMSSGEGSVGVSARPALPTTCQTSGKVRRIASRAFRSSPTCGDANAQGRSSACRGCCPRRAAA